jgi:pimeloyl-ACP methyl ester carboxylesterase
MSTVELPAGPIEYVDTGGDGPVIVFLHGLIMDGQLWRDVVPLLAPSHRCILPTLPLGAHRTPMRPGADLSLGGMVGIVADFLDRLDLHDVTLVHNDWGGALFLTAEGRDDRVARQVVCSCEAFDNFPPGRPGRLARLATWVPGGLSLALRQLRVGWMRRSPLLFGHMAKRPLPDDLVRAWTAPAIHSRAIRRDIRTYGRRTWPAARLTEATARLADFRGPALVVWAPETPVMPRSHGPRLAATFADGRLVEVEDAYVLLPLDQPVKLAGLIGEFVRASQSIS